MFQDKLANSERRNAKSTNSNATNRSRTDISTIVKEIAETLNLKTYYQSVLSCHDLRRTFATCNAKPLGLGLGLEELAGRLRSGVSILRQRWNHLPIKRAFREFMQAKQALKHVGKHGAVYYDAVFLKGLVEQYKPIADHIDRAGRFSRYYVVTSLKTLDA